MSSIKCTKALFKPKDNSASFVYKERISEVDHMAILWDEPATLKSLVWIFCDFAKDKLFIQKGQTFKIMEMYHNNPLFGGRPGITRMLRKIRLQYNWKNMTRDITRYGKSSAECQKNKSLPKTREPMIETETPTRAFDTIVTDTIGPFMRSNNGNEYAVTIICD